MATGSLSCVAWARRDRALWRPIHCPRCSSTAARHPSALKGPRPLEVGPVQWASGSERPRRGVHPNVVMCDRTGAVRSHAATMGRDACHIR